MLLNRLLFVGVVFSFLASCCFCWTAPSLPNPKQNPKACGVTIDNPSLNWVCSPDGQLADATIAQINKKINDFMALSQFHIACGQSNRPFQLAVVVVNRMEGYANGESFARHIMDEWKAGFSECNNGVVFAVAIENRKSGIYSGRGALDLVSSARATVVLDHMGDFMTQQKYDEAISDAVDQLLAFMQTQPSIIESITNTINLIFRVITYLCVACGVVAALIAICGPTSGRRVTKKSVLQGLKKQMETQMRLGKDHRRARATVCAICLEEFPLQSSTSSSSSSLSSSSSSSSSTSSSPSPSPSMPLTASSTVTAQTTTDTSASESNAVEVEPLLPPTSSSQVYKRKSPSLTETDVSAAASSSSSSSLFSSLSSSSSSSVSDSASSSCALEQEDAHWLAALESNPDIEILSCYHIFHRKCLDEWFRNSRTPSCPICRRQNPRSDQSTQPSAPSKLHTREFYDRVGVVDQDFLNFAATRLLIVEPEPIFRASSDFSSFGGGSSGGGGGASGSW
eukprot:TRINITY_DN476_c8_g1_i1.p1 TRINITY_DN476_c8_g1~~TRINITY_DN476_c8_g1_i1.p1  ORF type:complete len:511 (-),score=143.98 TRINITY_DN476_c8_g1_i1:269-1801(-)